MSISMHIQNLVKFYQFVLKIMGGNENLSCKRMTGNNQNLNIVLIFFHILVIKEYWVLMESRILLKLVLGDMRIVALSISSHE